MKQSNTFKRLGAGMVLTVFLLCCFLGTSFSLRPAYAEWEAAPVGSLNGGSPVISMEAIDKGCFEPGMTLEQPFYIENGSSDIVNYRFYFAIAEDVDASWSDILANTLKVSILERINGSEDRVLAEGTIASMNRETISPVIQYDYVEKKYIPNKYEELTAGEQKQLILQIHYPDTAGNEGNDEEIDFVLGLAFKAVNTTPENTEG